MNEAHTERTKYVSFHSPGNCQHQINWDYIFFRICCRVFFPNIRSNGTKFEATAFVSSSQNSQQNKTPTKQIHSTNALESFATFESLTFPFRNKIARVCVCLWERCYLFDFRRIFGSKSSFQCIPRKADSAKASHQTKFIHCVGYTNTITFLLSWWLASST